MGGSLELTGKPAQLNPRVTVSKTKIKDSLKKTTGIDLWPLYTHKHVQIKKEREKLIPGSDPDPAFLPTAANPCVPQTLQASELDPFQTVT